MSKYPKDDRVYIDHILKEIQDIESFTRNGERDDKTYKAVIRCFEVMGEATPHISEDFRRRYAGIDWRVMVAMRNVLIHNYLGIREKSFWQTVEDDIPMLKQQLLELQKTMGSK